MIPKFRAWLKKENRMINSVAGLDLGLPNQYVQWYEDGKGDCSDCLMQDAELMQYTGLHDKNGKEIYKGDIFKAPHDFGPGGFDVRQAVVRWHETQGYQWNYWLVDQLEVIGNIYENPELLEATT